MTAFIPPCMPTLVDKPPEGDDWAHEIKYDGYRTQIHLGATPHAFTRNGHDWLPKYASVVLSAATLIPAEAVIDGEIVVQDESGRSDFAGLASAIRWQSAKLTFYAFDLLSVGGRDLRQERCEDRRRRLLDLIGEPRPDSQIQFSQDFRGSGAEFFAAADQMGLEGIVSKRINSRYRSGDSRDWLKTKAYTTGEYIVIGYERKKGEAPSLLLADDGLRYVGRAIPAIIGAARDELWEALEFLQTDRWAAAVSGNKGAKPVNPALRVRARHLRGEEKLRHATVTEILAPDVSPIGGPHQS